MTEDESKEEKKKREIHSTYYPASKETHIKYSDGSTEIKNENQLYDIKHGRILKASRDSTTTANLLNDLNENKLQKNARDSSITASILNKDKERNDDEDKDKDK